MHNVLSIILRFFAKLQHDITKLRFGGLISTINIIFIITHSWTWFWLVRFEFVHDTV